MTGLQLQDTLTRHGFHVARTEAGNILATSGERALIFSIRWRGKAARGWLAGFPGGGGWCAFEQDDLEHFAAWLTEQGFPALPTTARVTPSTFDPLTQAVRPHLPGAA